MNVQSFLYVMNKFTTKITLLNKLKLFLLCVCTKMRIIA
jgi:hypothetical protein